ncbi:helix-turn-helix transcriptional regulator [Sphingobacterium sp. SGR-19]|uniref:helix-turn-helix transcriptional regulator n=1 Tax=Sphingobacterium sp. SGR-19 TaxID=2710886 RepID=UPI0013ED6FD2|nr:helix-turn-helix transcriptional regulator [Sphingobacterium sp. SGR-19]NGM65394.1 helix-turn-helix transcriptional regulator [Sphingobacterium sp. SGR-19]
MEDVFKIFRIDGRDAEYIATQVNEPHQHDYEELLIGTAGRLEHFIDFKSEIMEAPFISFVTQGKTHRVRPLLKDGRCAIWGIRFKSEFIAETAFRFYAAFHDRASFCMADGPCFHRLDVICQMMYDEYQQDVVDLSVIRDLLNTLFTMIQSERNKQDLNNDEANQISSNTFRNFLKLLDKYYKENREVNFYAERLFMSSRNLNHICQKVLHQSVSEIIETRKLTEAKNLLITTDLTIAEIGYALGYNEKTYFTHAFKRKSGITPSEFRKDMRKLIT